jgi:hypothetical protein
MLRANAAAVDLIRKSDINQNPVFHFIAAAAYARAGDQASAAAERDWIEANAKDLLKDVRRDLAKRLERPEDQAYFLEGLELAGLAVPAPFPEVSQ